MKLIRKFEEISLKDIGLVGGKNGSLGEMIQNLTPLGIKIPSGFVITSEGYKLHLQENNLEEKIYSLLKNLDKSNVEKLGKVGEGIRELISNAPLPKELVEEIISAYKKMGEKIDVAVRSSATAEDLPEASFAGQQETFLNVTGKENLLEVCPKAFASLFTDRAISYRIDHGFAHEQVLISLGIQKMIRSDLSSAGVIFTLDTESGHKDVIFINSSYGLGENVVKGNVNPDEFYIHKPTLEKNFKPILKKRLGTKRKKLIYSDNPKEPTINIDVDEKDQNKFSLSNDEILTLSKQSLEIEKYYSNKKGSWSPMDIEWAKDGNDNELYIVQARPETVHSLKQEQTFYEEFSIPNREANKDKIIATGKSIGNKISSGKARIISDASRMNEMKKGEILITDMTDPDWQPIMKIASGIITNRGGRTCHAAIVSRELGIPAIVGTIDATEKIKNEQEITLDCSGGEVGAVYGEKIEFETNKIEIKDTPKLPVEIMMNIGNPDKAFNFSKITNDGVGLARLEFIINSGIKIHPMALIHPEIIKDNETIQKIKSITYPYVEDIGIWEKIKDKITVSEKLKSQRKKFFIDKLAEEAGTIAAAFYPKPVIIRLSDFKSNEYRQLIGGKYFEPEEENPMLGLRGASRYTHESYKEAFELECLAMKKIREEMGLTNIKLMIPFARTIEESKSVLEVMNEYGLKKNENGLEIYVMCEIPSNVILADEFSKIYDGFSIGSNDLTQLTLGVDRDSQLVAEIFDERNKAVKKMLVMAIEGAKRNNKKIGICGQAPSDYPELAKFLIDKGINSISLNPDSVIRTIKKLI